MNRTLRILVRAILDLDEIVEWIRDRDERAAVRFHDRVQETIERIGEFPELAIAFVTRKRRQLRLVPVKRYRRFVIVYELTATTIDIKRILRGSRNLDEILDE